MWIHDRVSDRFAIVDDLEEAAPWKGRQLCTKPAISRLALDNHLKREPGIHIESLVYWILNAGRLGGPRTVPQHRGGKISEEARASR